MGSLDRLGKLLAIETFEALQDARACPALRVLLADEDETVVEWSARALGTLRCPDSVEPLKQVLARMIAEQVPPDWTGPVQVRAALADLGARRPMIPRTTMDLQLRRDDTEMWLCRSEDLATVFADLAEHSPRRATSRKNHTNSDGDPFVPRSRSIGGRDRALLRDHTSIADRSAVHGVKD